MPINYHFGKIKKLLKDDRKQQHTGQQLIKVHQSKHVCSKEIEREGMTIGSRSSRT